MDHKQSPNTMYGSESLHVPSGFEVESASLHMPVEGGITVSEPRSRSWKEKVTALPSRVKPMMNERIGTLKTQMSSVSTRVNGNLRGNPTKWAGIAAGAGLGIGLIGRFLHHRSHHKHDGLPAIVIIDAAC